MDESQTQDVKELADELPRWEEYTEAAMPAEEDSAGSKVRTNINLDESQE